MTAVPECVNKMPQMLRLSLEFNPISSSATSAPMSSASSTNLLGHRPRTDTNPIRMSLPEDGLHTSPITTEFKATEEFNAAFDHFIDSLDFSASKTANFLKVGCF